MWCFGKRDIHQFLHWDTGHSEMLLDVMSNFFLYMPSTQNTSFSNTRYVDNSGTLANSNLG